MEMVLQTKQLTKLYHKAPVLNEVSMNIERGDIYGFIGENGAGIILTLRQNSTPIW